MKLNSEFKLPALAAIVAGCCALNPSVATAQIILSSSASGQLDTVASSVSSPDPIFVGSYDGNGGRFWAEYVFQLPALGSVANPFTAATLAFDVVGSQYNNSYGYQSSPLVGLTSGGAPLTSASGTISGADGEISSTPLDLQIGYTDHTDLGVYSDSGANLLNYLNSAYDGGVGAGQYVYFQFQAGSGLIYFKGFDLSAQGTLNLTAVPEAGGWPMLACGAGALTILVRPLRRKWVNVTRPV